MAGVPSVCVWSQLIYSEMGISQTEWTGHPIFTPGTGVCFCFFHSSTATGLIKCMKTLEGQFYFFYFFWKATGQILSWCLVLPWAVGWQSSTDHITLHRVTKTQAGRATALYTACLWFWASPNIDMNYRSSLSDDKCLEAAEETEFTRPNDCFKKLLQFCHVSLLA